MRTDIAGAKRPENRVTEGMKSDISVGMSDQAPVIFDSYAAHHDMIARPKSVNIKPLSGPNLGIAGARTKHAFGKLEVLAVGHFEILLGARDQRDG